MFFGIAKSRSELKLPFFERESIKKALWSLAYSCVCLPIFIESLETEISFALFLT